MKRVFSSRTPFEDRPLTEQVAALRSLITDEAGPIRPLILRMARAAAKDFLEEIGEEFRLRLEQDPEFVAWQQRQREAQLATQMEAKRSILVRDMVLGCLSTLGLASEAELSARFAGIPAGDIEAALQALVSEGWISRSGTTYIRSGNYDAYDQDDDDDPMEGEPA